MVSLVHELITQTAQRTATAEALRYQGQHWTYASLAEQVKQAAHAFVSAGIRRSERVAVYLEKRLEVVPALFGASAAHAVFVPVNPLLKPDQLAYILQDCNVKILVTSAERLRSLSAVLATCPDLHTVFVVGNIDTSVMPDTVRLYSWQNALAVNASAGQIDSHAQCIDSDMAAILYTSGSTGKPKGVVLSHRNIIAGAISVAGYLNNHAQDRILAVLPLSFDYGLSQLTTAFYVGATVVLMNYLFPRDIIHAVTEENITGLAGVPPLWIQLSQQVWPAKTSLRYLTNSGGAIQKTTLQALRTHVPDAQVFLMYGLTEAFRSTYLPPAEIDARPDSIGRAIPNAEILVINQHGQECAPGEVGELVHRGALVALGYWNDPARTAERFKPLTTQLSGLPMPETAVWSGDLVRKDEDGYLYFLGRQDEQIKVSGYRISPTEIEEIAHTLPGVTEVVVFGVAHPVTGHAIVMMTWQAGDIALSPESLRKECQLRLPAYMVPAHIEITTVSLPRNPNGKIDRASCRERFAGFFLNKPND